MQRRSGSPLIGRLDSPEIDWLLFFCLFPAVVGTVVVFGAGILLAAYWSFWLVLTLIGILVVPLCAAAAGALGIGSVSFVRLWWALISPPKKQPLTDYYFTAVCVFFALVAVLVCLQNPLLEESWNTLDFDGNEFFGMSVGFVALTLYPPLALIVALRVRFRPAPTALARRRTSQYMAAGAAIVAFWAIGAAGVIHFQRQIAPLVKSMRMSAAPWSDPRYRLYEARGPIADSICQGNLESAREALHSSAATTLTDASVRAVMECLIATRWTNGGRTTQTVFMEERVPLILDVILGREQALAVNSVAGCTAMQVSLQKKLIELGQLASLRVFLDRHLSINCHDSSGNPVF
jgi:hypothetical protein